MAEAIQHFLRTRARTGHGWHTWALPLLVAGALLIFFVFTKIPMAYRWPARVLIGAGVAAGVWELARHIRWAFSPPKVRSIALLGVTLGLLTGAAILGHPLIVLKMNQLLGLAPTPEHRVAADRAVDLGEELKKRGIQLAVVALPTYENVFPESREPSDLPLKIEEKVVGKALNRAAAAGVRTGDLTALFREQADDRALWKDDEYHLTEEGIRRMAVPLAHHLEQAGMGPGADGERKIVLMGNCFAGQFAEAIRETLPSWRHLRGISARGDEGRVADLLFLFPDEYLVGTELVIWLTPYPHLTKSDLCEVNYSPDLSGAERRQVTLRVVSALAWDKDGAQSRLATMPYPNGLAAVEAERRSEDGTTERISALGYGVMDRKLTPLGLITPGKRIVANLVPLEAYFAKDKKAATEYRLNDPMSPESPAQRYWIHSWTFVR